ncbi:MAG: acyl-CoA thioesterase [Bacteroidia bacterium]|nr:acyl-CoA thioesterase [Bacteroidia bacterium]
MENGKFSVKLELRIDWSEMDLYGHVNNVSYFKYIQAGRVNYWRATGITEMFEKEKIGPILASTHMDFKSPLHFPGNIVVETRMESIGNSSFCLQHRILNEKKEIAAEAKDVIVVYDFNKNEKILFPDRLRKEVERIEGRKI